MKSRAVQTRVLDLPSDIGLPEVLRALQGERGLVALDSAGGEPRQASIVAWNPLEFGEYPNIESIRGLAASLDPMSSAPGPFQGGFLGAIPYDLGVQGESLDLPEAPWGPRAIIGGTYTDFVVWDHSKGTVALVLGSVAGGGRADLNERERHFYACLRTEGGPRPARGVGPLRRWVPPETHAERIEKVRDFIAAGEIYQANLAHGFEQSTLGRPVDLYCALREVNPAPYMGYLSWTQAGIGPHEVAHALLSASPELLLECRDGRVRTRPIKGTCRRGSSPEEDQLLGEALLRSQKDRAELAMIVDLERNDISRVCRVGSVQAQGFPSLRRYPTVQHLEADVVGLLDDPCDGLDALGALFPGGSITGAPKLRSMEVIAQLEGRGRGLFCGTLGFVDARGFACWNILIRSMHWRAHPTGVVGEGNGEVSFQVGGGITWSSEADREEAETLEKAQALVDTLRAAPARS